MDMQLNKELAEVLGDLPDREKMIACSSLLGSLCKVLDDFANAMPETEKAPEPPKEDCKIVYLPRRFRRNRNRGN